MQYSNKHSITCISKDPSTLAMRFRARYGVAVLALRQTRRKPGIPSHCRSSTSPACQMTHELLTAGLERIYVWHHRWYFASMLVAGQKNAQAYVEKSRIEHGTLGRASAPHVAPSHVEL